MMIGEIFRKASRVLVWLGEHADSSESVFRDSHRPWFQSWDERKKHVSWSLPRDQEEHELKAWTAFFARPYWTRTWIIQEIVLAKAIIFHCGPDTADWSLVTDDYPYFRRGMHHRVDTDTDEEADIIVLRDQFEKTSSVADALSNARWRPEDNTTLDQVPTGVFSAFESDHGVRYSKCYDRRDKIYGLLSLETDGRVRKGIMVDYTASIPRLFLQVLSAISHSHDQGNWRRRTSRLILHMDLSREELVESVDDVIDANLHLDQAMLDNVAFIVIHTLKLVDQSFNHEFGIRISRQRSDLLFVVKDEEQERRKLRQWRDDAKRRGIWPSKVL